MLMYMQSLLGRLAKNEEGQTAVEYGLVLALVALVIVGILATGATQVINDVVANIEAAL